MGDRLQVVIADVDPQASSAFWRQRRQQPAPEVVQLQPKRLKRERKRLAASGVDLLIVDTPPHSSSGAALAAANADMVLIPTRPAILDLQAIGDSVAVVEKAKTSGAVALNCCPPPTRRGETAIVREAREALTAYGLPVAPVALSQRAAFSHALIDGRAVTEYDARGKAAAEMRALWKWVKQELYA